MVKCGIKCVKPNHNELWLQMISDFLKKTRMFVVVGQGTLYQYVAPNSENPVYKDLS